MNPKDAYKDDWELSQVYRKALKREADKRGIEFVDPVSDEENMDDLDDSSMHMERVKFNESTGKSKKGPSSKSYKN